MATSTAPALPEQAGLNSLPSSLPRIDVRGDSPAADQPRIRRSITLDSTPAKQKMAKAQLRRFVRMRTVRFHFPPFLRLAAVESFEDASPKSRREEGCVGWWVPGRRGVRHWNRAGPIG